jgi:hypothetical protein
MSVTLLTEVFSLLNVTDQEILLKLKPYETAQLLHEALLKRVGVLAPFKGALAEERVSTLLSPTQDIVNTNINSLRGITFEHEIVSKTSFSTDVKVMSKGKVIYVEVKNYKDSVPQKEVDKFYRDIDTKVNIHGALFIGGPTSFKMHNGLPVLFIESDILLTQSLEILFSLDRRVPTQDTIKRILDSMDDISSMHKTIDDMSTSFNKSIGELKKTLILFQERCRGLEVIYEETFDMSSLHRHPCHLTNNKELFNFVTQLINNGQGTPVITGSSIEMPDLKVGLLKTKTTLTFPAKKIPVNMDNFKMTKGKITIDLTIDTLQDIRYMLI